MLFNTGVYFWYGQERAFQFLTVYLLEKSLSIDNIFVFLLIFTYFKIAAEYQYKILFWGILWALGIVVALLAVTIVASLIRTRFNPCPVPGSKEK
jgi:tellurite resistance protein TerC